MAIHLVDYQSQPASAENALAVWCYQPERAAMTRVIPDGCIDYIIYRDTQAPSSYCWMLSELSTATYQVRAQAGDKMQGVRLKAGVSVDTVGLSQYLKSHSVASVLQRDAIDEFCQRSEALASALQCLSSGISSIQNGASELGVSTRTLQRLVLRETGRSPHFWLSLARVRRAAKGIFEYDSLAEVAAAYHFSDQAHMCRAMQHWFNLTPGQLKADSEMQTLLADLAYV